MDFLWTFNAYLYVIFGKLFNLFWGLCPLTCVYNLLYNSYFEYLFIFHLNFRYFGQILIILHVPIINKTYAAKFVPWDPTQASNCQYQQGAN